MPLRQRTLVRRTEDAVRGMDGGVGTGSRRHIQRLVHDVLVDEIFRVRP